MSHTAGDFTLAVSAFSPTHRGAFSLLVRSSRRVEVEPIPQEGAGMFAKTVRGEWYVTSVSVVFLSVGPVPLLTDFRTNGTNPRYTLELPTPTQVK
jgi:calpain-7